MINHPRLGVHCLSIMKRFPDSLWKVIITEFLVDFNEVVEIDDVEDVIMDEDDDSEDEIEEIT